MLQLPERDRTILCDADRFKNLICEIGGHWQSGCDTYEMAELLGVHEATVCRALHRWRDANRAGG